MRAFRFCGATPADAAIADRVRRRMNGQRLGHSVDGKHVSCARVITETVRRRGLSKRAAVIALTTAITESGLRNYIKPVDHDSLGLFQQRPSQGWGTPRQLINPVYATNAFLRAMLRKYPNNRWKRRRIGAICQKVQVSAVPGAYAREVHDARLLANALWRRRAAADQQLGSSVPKPHRVIEGVKPGSGGSGKRNVINLYRDAKLARVGRKIARLVAHYPKVGGLYITSGYRGYGNDHHGGLFYRGSPTAAIDVGAYDSHRLKSVGQRRMRDFARWLEDKVPGHRSIVELIHTTPYGSDNGFYVKNGRKLGAYGYGPETNRAHINHVHLAMSNRQVKAALKRLRQRPGAGLLGGSEV